MDQKFEDYYAILQVHPHADTDAVNALYKRLCKKYHPDINPSALARHKMQQINRAHQVLSDPNRRRAFHKEWSTHGLNAKMAPPTEPQVVYVDRPVEKIQVVEKVVEKVVHTAPIPFGGGTPDAARTILSYFDALAHKDYYTAYSFVSQADCSFVSFEDFSAWRSAVDTVLETSVHSPELFRKHVAFRTIADTLVPTEEFSVEIVEKNRKTGEVRNVRLTRHAVFENEMWRVYLGYRDVRALKIQFELGEQVNKDAVLGSLWENYLAKNDLNLGVLNRAGFVVCMEREIYRHTRYTRPFSVGIFAVTSNKDQQALRIAANTLKESVRPIDCVGYLGDNLFCLLLAETPKAQAISALRRLIKTVRRDIAGLPGVEFAASVGAVQYNGDSVEDMIQAGLATIRASAVVELPFLPVAAKG